MARRRWKDRRDDGRPHQARDRVHVRRRYLLFNRPTSRDHAGGRTYYNRFWWGQRVDAARCDFFAMGVLGQHVYVCPEARAVVVRLSNRFPPGIWWAPLLRRIIDAAR